MTVDRKIASWSFAVVVLLGLAAAVVFSGGDPLPTSPTTGPDIVCPGEICAGSPKVCGYSTDLDGGISVSATLNGTDPLNAVSGSSTGQIATYCFDTSGAVAGDFVVISSTDRWGNTTTSTVDVIDCL